SIPAARRMIVDADPVEACLLAAGDERGDVRQRAADGDAEIDADPGHLTKAPALSKRTRLSTFTRSVTQKCRTERARVRWEREARDHGAVKRRNQKKRLQARRPPGPRRLRSPI